jgi:hypothetical protein
LTKGHIKRIKIKGLLILLARILPVFFYVNFTNNWPLFKKKKEVKNLVGLSYTGEKKKKTFIFTLPRCMATKGEW